MGNRLVGEKGFRASNNISDCGRKSKDRAPHRQLLLIDTLAVEYPGGGIVHLTVEMSCGCDIDATVISRSINLHRDQTYDDYSDSLGMIGRTFST